jgi:TIR domain
MPPPTQPTEARGTENGGSEESIRIFVSYRREDSPGTAGRIRDRLGQQFREDNIFLDVGSIVPGRPWKKAIDEAISSCHVVIGVIGPNWLKIRAEGRRWLIGRQRPRILDPNDQHRAELEYALENKIPVFPVLVGGAKMPDRNKLPGEPLRDLCDIQAFVLMHEEFDAGFERLLTQIRVVESTIQRRRRGATQAEQQFELKSAAVEQAEQPIRQMKEDVGDIPLESIQQEQRANRSKAKHIEPGLD